MGSKRETLSLQRALEVLRLFGCPQIRAGEGSDEWRSKNPDFAYSPDLVAGPLRGNGHQLDFFIDVFHPTGKQYTEPKAGNPAAVEILRKAVAERGSFNLRDIGDPEGILQPIRKKIEKYSLSRDSRMTALAIYQRVDRSGGYVGSILAHHHTIDLFDRYFGLTHYCGAQAVKEMAATLSSPLNCWEKFVLPFHVPLAFIMSITDICSTDGVTTKVVMLINRDMIAPNFDAADHDVITWLRTVTQLPE